MRSALICGFVLLSAIARGQEPVAPTPEKVGPVRGENTGDYNVLNSFEFGYRYNLIGGNTGKYRSDVNYRNGVRLLGSSLTVNSRDGHGRWFDEIVLTTQGLGNDPYESAVLRVQKNQAYRYDMTWRLNEYFNPGLVIANGQHFQNTNRRWQDHELTLFPQSKFRVRAGYGRNSEDGPALSTESIFDPPRGDEFALFSNVRRQFNEYRVGGDLDAAGFKLTVLRRWEFYKEDTPYFLNGFSAGNNPTDRTTLSQFRRAEPYHGSTPSWLVNLRTEHRSIAANGRFTYSSGRRNFILDEDAIGTDRLGARRNLQTLVFGDAQRPVATGDLAVSYFATDRFTIVNNTSIYNARISGNASLLEFNNFSLDNQALNFQFLGIRLVTNSTEAQFRFTNKLSAYVGYHFASRLIRSIESAGTPGFPADSIAAHQTNHLKAGVAGINFSPIQPLKLHLEAEAGNNDNPFYPISERKYHAFDARARYRRKTVQASAGYRQNYNNNSITLTAYSAKARNYFGDVSWAARDWVSLDAGYSRLHLDTIGGIAFFAGIPRQQLVEGRQSVYISNTHAANLGLRFTILKRADLYAGYSITRDVGDGRGSASLGSSDRVSALLNSVQTFPLSFQSPAARLSVRINQKVRWNAGYQFYGYHEDFGLFSIYQNYRGHTGYTSVLWSF